MRHEPRMDELDSVFELKTNEQHTIVVPIKRLRVRLAIDPKRAESFDDRFILYETDPEGDRRKQLRTTKDDMVKGDEYVDLMYDHLRPDHKYTLMIDPGAEGAPYPLFEDVPYEDIITG